MCTQSINISHQGTYSRTNNKHIYVSFLHASTNLDHRKGYNIIKNKFIILVLCIFRATGYIQKKFLHSSCTGAHQHKSCCNVLRLIHIAIITEHTSQSKFQYPRSRWAITYKIYNVKYIQNSIYKNSFRPSILFLYIFYIIFL